ncbi:MAG: hypothetical protein ACK5XN_30855 [Bacteroidota bacterium]
MDITFLKEDQIWGDKALQALKSYGTKTGLSDLAIVLGGAIGSDSNKTSDNQLSGYVWSASSGGGAVRRVRAGGDRDGRYPGERLVGARPDLPSSVASSIRLSEAKPSRKISGVDVVEYGEYPQTIASETVNRELEQVFSRGQLQTTGKKYTFDGEAVNAHDKPFKAKEYAEYQHNGKRYIRVEAKPYDNDSVLSTGRKPQAGEACWIEVQPIEWLRDPSGICVARQVLFAGVQFDKKQRYDGNFENTDMKQYLQNHFAKEMQAGRNVGTPAALGPNTTAVTKRRDTQRQRALDDPSQGL